MSQIRRIFFYGPHFEDFYFRREKGAQEKIDQVLSLISHVENVPKKFFKRVESTDGIFEIRVSYGPSAFRIFCFFETGRKLILLNGFIKKSIKTPGNELRMAVKLKNEYSLSVDSRSKNK